MTSLKITIPDMGDFKDVEIIEVLVKEGQTVKKNDSLITLESDKSSVEVPSTYDGKIESINLKIGDKVNKGDLILTLKSQAQEEAKKTVKKEVKEIEKPTPKKEASAPSISTAKGGIKLASPKVRKFARELGANVIEIPGSQRAGRISEKDVKNFIKSQVTLIFLFLPIEQKKTAKLLHSNKGGLHGIVRELASNSEQCRPGSQGGII